MRIISVAVILLSLFGFSLAGMAGHQARILDIRTLSAPATMGQVVLDVSEPVKYTLFTLGQDKGKSHRVVLDLHNTRLVGAYTAPINHPLITTIRSGERKNGKDTRLVFDVKQAVNARALTIKPAGRYGHRLALTLEIPGQTLATPSAPPTSARIVHVTPPQFTPSQSKSAPQAAPSRQVAKPVAVHRPAPTAQTTSNLPRPVSYANKKRKLIVAIDAGHGGIDPGATGTRGVQEKTVTLAVAQRLAKLINRQKGMQAALIRDGDYFLSLQDRINRARQFKADVFISLHADSYKDNSRIQGSSVYILSQSGASSEAAKWLAERENGADLLGGTNTVSLKDKSDVLASILLDLSQTGTLEASSQLGGELLGGLAQVGPVFHKQIQKAAFQVLKSPDIPSVLIEMAFISNPQEESKLTIPTEQQKLAQALLNGLKTYFRRHAPPGTLLARQ
jgi:N-acetylmuramoyl-L-alanine amidase